MTKMSMWAARGCAVLGWLGIGFCFVGLFAIRPDGLAAWGVSFVLGAMWLVAPFALGPIIWDVTEPLPKHPPSPRRSG